MLLTFGGRGGGGVVQNTESPDFRSPEVGRYANSHANTPLGQSERAYYLSYFIITSMAPVRSTPKPAVSIISEIGGIGT